MKTIQIKDHIRLNAFSTTILNRLINKGLIKLLGGVSEKHLAEDEIKEFLYAVLEQGLSNYDVVALAGEQTECMVSTAKETDGVWRMIVEVGNDSFTIHKDDVIDLAVKSYRLEAERALAKY